MGDFILNVRVRKGSRWIVRSIYPGIAQDSILRTIATDLAILPVIAVKLGGANVTEVAQNQVIVRRTHERTWRFPEDSIDLRCIRHNRATVVLQVAATLDRIISTKYMHNARAAGGRSSV